MRKESGSYVYKPITVPGGGFVTGFVFHPEVPGILYCRTDIGGTYRYDYASRSWISLIDHATDPGMWETYPLSIALDRQNPSYIYVMTGLSPTHKIAFSENYGGNWTYYDAPVVDLDGNTAGIHGNAPGRSTGERLVVDPYDSNTLYMGTMADGLWKTTDRCRTWQRLQVCAPGGKPERNIAFVCVDPASSGGSEAPDAGQAGNSDAAAHSHAASQSPRSAAQRLIVATSGEQGSPGGNVRGPSVYISQDGGLTFKPLAGEPSPVLGGKPDYPGYVGQRAAFDGPYVYISYAACNVGWSTWDTYGCDTGKCYDGALYRYMLNESGEVAEAVDITPPPMSPLGFRDTEAPERRLGYGISGISTDARLPGTLICSTITASPDTIYRSTDYGATWKPVLSGLEVGKIDFNVSYQKPEYNGQHSLVHWMSDLKIDPFESNRALFNTGAGIFMTENLTAADRQEEVIWACRNNGVEETVHLNIYSPPAGEVQLIDIIGDYGGFIFTDLDRPAENTFANDQGDRWITAMNADYPDGNPELLVVTPRGNWTGRTKGGLILSRDQGRTWEQLQNPTGLSEAVDEWVRQLGTPNVTSGWTAISADGETILWVLGIPVFASRLVYTRDCGKAWARSRVYDRDGRLLEGDGIPFKVMADRVRPEVFYGFSDHVEGRGFYLSTDQGATFHEAAGPEGFPAVNLAGIDSEQHYEIRVEPGAEGVIWMAMLDGGLWRLACDFTQRTFRGERVSEAGDWIKRIGFGKPEEGSTVKTLFTSGTIRGEYGFYRSHDGGTRWLRINDDRHQYGDIRSITGDPRVFGRIYVATGTRGLVYGDIVWEEEAEAVQ